jgi:hypothetical protein
MNMLLCKANFIIERNAFFGKLQIAPGFVAIMAQNPETKLFCS